jgi:AcrR family transcriptional regulator
MFHQAMSTMAKPKTKRGQVRRAQILGAAETVIGSQGFSASSIVDITRAAAAAPGTFYIYFKSKEELFRELVTEMGLETRATVAQAIVQAPDRLSAERAGLEAFLRFVAARPTLYRIVEEARFVDPDAYRSYFAGFADAYATGLREAEATGEISPGDAEVRAWALMGMAKALGDRYVLWDDAPDISHVVDEAHAMICKGLAP